MTDDTGAIRSPTGHSSIQLFSQMSHATQYLSVPTDWPRMGGRRGTRDRRSKGCSRSKSNRIQDDRIADAAVEVAEVLKLNQTRTTLISLNKKRRKKEATRAIDTTEG